jgi:threonine/homoserine/homoserine lactone efflux protein
MSVDATIALLVFLFPLAYSPGPGNAFFAVIGASSGFRAAARALVGYHVATLAVTALIGVGIGAALLGNPVVAPIIAAAGALYVLWLAFTFVRSTRRDAPTSGERSDAETVPKSRIGFWAGVLVLVLNPKAYSIIAVMFAQFLQPPSNDDIGTVLMITLIFTINNLVAFIMWTLLGRALTALFRGERAQRWINDIFAAMLVGVAIWMAAPLFIGLWG